MTKQEQPIGIFDSGVGGLTVANAIRMTLPNENLVYMGDTAHLPYGDKSAEAVRHYSVRITDFLLQQGAKIIVIACNTASAFASEAIQNHLKATAPDVAVVNVIDPIVKAMAAQKRYTRIGIIGTKGTIASGTYQERFRQLASDKQLSPLATPLFAPMIEEGFIYDDISNAIIRTYLSNSALAGIDSLILACTHYPVIKNQIRKFYNFQTKVIDASDVVAKEVRSILQTNDLLNDVLTPAHKFFVTDYTDYFKHIASIFFEEEIALNKANLWL